VNREKHHIMPIFMDRHDVSDAVTAEHIAQLHQQDLKVQDQFGCRGLTYWFDDKRKTAFCLIEAPHMDAIREMHDFAHGQVPHRVIEVDTDLVESFLGRIEDPVKERNTGLNIIDDPAFRAIMVMDVQPAFFSNGDPGPFRAGAQLLMQRVPAILKAFDGAVVKQSPDRHLISFRQVSCAVHAAIELRKSFDVGGEGHTHQMKIGLSTGVPVTEKRLMFEDAIRLAERMAVACREDIVVSAEVRELYDGENPAPLATCKGVCCLTPADEQFLTRLMDHAEKNWSDIHLKVDDLNKVVGYSKPQLYRKMIVLTGKSPVTFIKDYRLNEALSLLNKQTGNVSQIAYESGFSSPSILPSASRNDMAGRRPNTWRQGPNDEKLPAFELIVTIDGCRGG